MDLRKLHFWVKTLIPMEKILEIKKPKLDLLIQKSAQFDSIKRIWFMTSYPSDITDSLIDTIAKEKKGCKIYPLTRSIW